MDPLDDEYTIFNFDLANRVGNEVAAACVDLARLQRASQGARQSTGCGGDHPVDRRGIRRKVFHRHPVMLGDVGVDSKCVVPIFGRQPDVADGTPDPLYPDIRSVFDVSHGSPLTPCYRDTDTEPTTF